MNDARFHELVDKLRKIVYVTGRDVNTMQAADLVELFQEVNGLHVDGLMGPTTARYIERPRFCGVKDRLVLDASQKCRWDHTTWDGKQFRGQPAAMPLGVHLTGTLPGLTTAQTNECVDFACNCWNAVCAVNMVRVGSAGQANLVLDVERIDGPAGTLAWQELPCGQDSPSTKRTGRYDAGESGTFAENPAQGKVDWGRIMAHELGHGIGLDHLAEGCLLAPYYDRSIRVPQEGDIKEARLRYGPPVTVVPTPTPGPKATCEVLLLDGTKYHGTLERV